MSISRRYNGNLFIIIKMRLVNRLNRVCIRLQVRQISFCQTTGKAVMFRETGLFVNLIRDNAHVLINASDNAVAIYRKEKPAAVQYCCLFFPGENHPPWTSFDRMIHYWDLLKLCFFAETSPPIPLPLRVYGSLSFGEGLNIMHFPPSLIGEGAGGWG